MLPRKNKVIVTVPHRISGFFEIVDEINGSKIINPEKIGSRGAGFNLNSFGRTKVIFEKNNMTHKEKQFSIGNLPRYLNLAGPQARKNYL